MTNRLAAIALVGAASLAAAAGPAPTAVVILDNSGSMAQEMRGGDTRMEAAKRALEAVLDRTPRDARIGVILLNPPRIGDDWLIPLGPVDLEPTRRAIRRVVAQGPTPLGGAMKLAADALLAARSNRSAGEFKVLIVSDGEATDGNLVDRYVPVAQARGLMIDVIGVDMPENHSLASRANSYRSADDPMALERAISEVVLGETTTDWDDTGAETDFDILAGLPGEVAVEALKALTTPSEAPLGGTPLDGAEPGFADNRPLDASGPTPPRWRPGGSTLPEPAHEPEVGGGGIGNVFFFLIVAFFILTRLLKAAKHR